MKSIKTILAIETSCDETAAAVIKNGKIISNVVASQAKLHSKFGGVVPEVAAREHIPAMIPTIDLAIKQAKIKLNDLDAIAVTQGPGLVTSLTVGIDTAKALGLSLNIPLLPINHMEAHIYANFVDVKGQRSRFPALILVVSGGHTMLVLMADHGKYQLIGETIDDAAGEAFDKTAKLMGLGYPGGPQISRQAKAGNPEKFKFPRPLLNSPTLDFSFSGLKTAVLYEYVKHKKSKQLVADTAASLQQAIVDSLIGKTEQAIKKHQPKSLMLGGGVAANALLRKEFEKLGRTYDLTTSIPPFEYCTDNAGMIGLAAWHKLQSKRAVFSSTFDANPQLELK